MINTEFNSILDLLKAFPDEQSCIDHLELLRWNGEVVSPFDSTSKVYDCKGNRYKCKNTGKYFNVKTSTLFDNTKIKLQKWFLAIYLVTSHKKGISSIQLGKDIGVTQKTAWFMLQRIRACFGQDDNEPMSGDVQVDETYVGGKLSNMHSSKKDKMSKGSGNVHKVPVIGIMNEEKVVVKQISKADKATILPILNDKVSKEATIVTDNFGVYNGLHKTYKAHVVVAHSKGTYVWENYSTNALEGFWSLFKRSIIGIYHHVTPKHIQKYIDESVYRYNTRLMSEAERMNLLFSKLETRTTYKELIYG